MTRALKAHYDGRVLVPDEPVDLPVNEPLQVVVSADEKDVQPTNVEQRLRALKSATGILTGPILGPEVLRRENIYDDEA